MAEMTTSFNRPKEELSKEKFIRDSLVEIYSAADAPVAINDIELSEPVADTAVVVRQFTMYNIESYNVEIGYDSKEQYIDTKRVYDSTLKEYVTREVVKERTVTKWQPYKGDPEKVSGFAKSVYNDGDGIDIGDKAEKVAECFDYTVDFGAIISDGEFRDATAEEAKQLAPLSEEEHRMLAYASAGDNLAYKLSLPGDHWRNFNAKWNIDYADATVYSINGFKTSFELGGEKCFVKEFATEAHPRVYCTGKGTENNENTDERVKQALSADTKFQETIKLYKYGTFGSIALGLLSLILSTMFDALSFVGIIGIIAAVAVFVFSYMTFGKKAQSMSQAVKSDIENQMKEYGEEQKAKKIELLNARLAKMGMAPLTDEELERFSEKSKHLLTDNYLPPEELDEDGE